MNAQIVFRDFDLKVCTYDMNTDCNALLMAALLIGTALDSNKSGAAHQFHEKLISRKISWNWFHEKTICNNETTYH